MWVVRSKDREKVLPQVVHSQPSSLPALVLPPLPPRPGPNPFLLDAAEPPPPPSVEDSSGGGLIPRRGLWCAGPASTQGLLFGACSPTPSSSGRFPRGTSSCMAASEGNSALTVPRSSPSGLGVPPRNTTEAISPCSGVPSPVSWPDMFGPCSSCSRDNDP
ncbi:hypothetical protein T484DRAFT_1928611 [Baffinella frigidus]|nr:hypothetical protein T484DRAFT_1928611 [Cryptophyta sp. CCMP2293]